MRAKLDCGQSNGGCPCVIVSCLLSFSKGQKLLGSLGSNIGSLVFEDFSKYRKSSRKHYMSNHLRVVAVVSSGIGPQGNISMIHMFSVVISEDLT